MNNTENSESKVKRKLMINALFVCVLFTGLGFLICSTVLARNTKEETISVTEIEQLMKRGSVETILMEEYDSGLIQKVEYDRRKEKTNFDELVYQEHLNPENRKPVLVFFYNNQNYTTKSDEREAILIKKIINTYYKKIKLVIYDVSIEPDYTGKINKGIFGTEVRREKVKGTCSLAMYSIFDLFKGETSNKNNRKIKQIDILQKGPSNNNLVNTWLKFIRDKWIPTNITSPNNVYAWKFNNSCDEKKIIYN